MPPSLRRRGQAVPQSPQFEDDSPVPSSDEEPEIIETGSIEDDLEDLARAEEAMNADDEDDEPLGECLCSILLLYFSSPVAQSAVISRFYFRGRICNMRAASDVKSGTV